MSISAKSSIQLAWLICIVNFINALDTMMVNPLFPFMAKFYQVPVSYVGYASGIYLLSAVISGFIIFFYIDKLNKRNLLLLNLLAIATLSFITPFISNFYYFIGARFISGIFAGFIFTVAMSIILSQTLLELRAKVIAIVMTSYALISLVGLPFITFLAGFVSWRAPFLFVSLLSLLMFFLGYYFVMDNPSISKKTNTAKIDYRIILAASSMGVSQFGSILLIPLLVPIFIYIFAVPISHVPFIFLIGGIASFSATHITRFLVQKFSIGSVIMAFTILFILNTMTLIINGTNAYLFMFVYMFTVFARTVAITSYASLLSSPQQFDKYSSIQTNVLNLCSLIAYVLPSLILQGGVINLASINSILVISMLTIAVLPLYLLLLHVVKQKM